ncbi:hypothetical protein DSM106972_072200 [Dulcicalothrix desertica PCC 7102]|uniref:Uncharacterized protein n=2 Tax=Dulcicalothrix desertica TaxID=32056 RepID=A0A433V3Y6_9CYAN|nr:hypothetical protein DSM106972_072200 [Dulcicalothrix desertica PCC 7102]
MQGMRPTPRNFRRRYALMLWERWVVVNVVAEILSFTIISIIIHSIKFAEDENSNNILILMGLIRGVVLGVARYWVLRRYLSNFIFWLVVTTIAEFLEWILLLMVSTVIVLELALNTEMIGTLSIFLKLLWLGASMGILMGFAQGLAMIKYLQASIKQIAWWINANAFASAIGVWLGFMSLGTGTFFNLVMIGVIMGITYGGITGFVLIYVLILPYHVSTDGIKVPRF